MLAELKETQERNRMAALAAAASAKAHALAAENAANIAINSERDVAGATTNSTAQQLVTQTCASATQAVQEEKRPFFP